MALNLDQRYEQIMGQIFKNPHLRKYTDRSQKIPDVFRGGGEIRLVVLGQDPTVKNAGVRKDINVVLNLNRDGILKNYINLICNYLDIDIEKNIYATNCLKNFFVEPPAMLEKDGVEIMEEALGYWLPLLRDELSEFQSLPTIILGDPILPHVVHRGIDHNIRDYWDYKQDWKENPGRSFRFIKPEDNQLKRPLFPFPYLPLQKSEFYETFLSAYIKFMKDNFD